MVKKLVSKEIIGPISNEGGMMMDVTLGKDLFTCCWVEGKDSLTDKGELAFQQFCDYMNADRQIMLFHDRIIVIGDQTVIQQDIISMLQPYSHGDVICFQGEYRQVDKIIVQAAFNVVDIVEVYEMSQFERQLINEIDKVKDAINQLAKNYSKAPADDKPRDQVTRRLEQYFFQLVLITKVAAKSNGGCSGEAGHHLNNILFELDYSLKERAPWIKKIFEQYLPIGI